MLSSGLGIIGFSWASSPACTELETIIMQWLGNMSGLPEFLLPFENSHKQNGFDSSSNSHKPDTKVEVSHNGMINKDFQTENSKSKPFLQLHNKSVHWGGGVLLVTFFKDLNH